MIVDVKLVVVVPSTTTTRLDYVLLGNKLQAHNKLVNQINETTNALLSKSDVL